MNRKDNRYINMLSDVVTLPTQEMRQAMYDAECGDDVARLDPTVNKLEEMAAKLVGKEAALYVSSGTMGNLLALMTHCTEHGTEVIMEEESHIYYYEVGGMASIAGLLPRLVKGKNGIMQPEDVRKAFREANVHYAVPGLICLENSHNRGGGTVIPLDNLAEIQKIAREKKVPVHMDGARLFNAATALNVDAKEITQYVDTVTFCLSKGLSAPVGSLLCGSEEFINRARRNRKMIGGGMRQAGTIAAAGIVALESMVDRLKEDHANARLFAEKICGLPGISIKLETVETNIVIFDVEGTGISSDEFVKKMNEGYGVAMQSRPPYAIRATMHRHISEEDVLHAVEVMKAICTK